MMKKFFRTAAALALSAMFALLVMAQSNPKPKPSPQLDTKNDPTLIGKRDINKGAISFYSIDREVALGRQMSYEIDMGVRLIGDPIVNEYINRIAQNIVLHSDAKVPFTIKVIDAPEVNAFALPGGFLYVNRGLLEAAENEAEVAGVMAHEIAHVTARHGIEQMSKGQLLQYGSLPLIFLGGLGGFVIQQAAGIAVPLTYLKFSRGAEKEADRLGAQYMWASGYDPNALITFFEKLQAQEQRKPGTLEKIFSTHPMTGDRITEVRELIVKFPDRSSYQINSSEFRQVKSRLVADRPKPENSGEDGRPRLKRGQSDKGDDRASDSADSEPTDRPVLKRREGSSDSTTSTASGNESETGRPVLKRREGSADSTTSTASGNESETGRPVLKRRESSEPNEQPEPEKQAPSSSSGSEAPDRPKLKKNNQTSDSTAEKSGQTSSSSSESSSSSTTKPPAKP
ncbi:MAG: M48 family metalloprotease [Blastocatellia bacterium]